MGQFLMSESATAACPECAGITVEQLALPMVTLTQGRHNLIVGSAATLQCMR